MFAKEEDSWKDLATSSCQLHFYECVNYIQEYIVDKPMIIVETGFICKKRGQVCVFQIMKVWKVISTLGKNEKASN